MILRMSAALLSLLGLFIAAYLYLYKIGKIGSLACGTGGCETVQWSPWAQIGGMDVSLVGIIGYAGLLALSLAALQPGLLGRRGPAVLLAVLAGIGVVFNIYITNLELFVIHAICRWCVASAAVILAIFIVAILDVRRSSPSRNS